MLDVWMPTQVLNFSTQSTQRPQRSLNLPPTNAGLAAVLALLGLVFGFGEGDLIHGDAESYALAMAILSLILRPIQGLLSDRDHLVLTPILLVIKPSCLLPELPGKTRPEGGVLAVFIHIP